MSTITATTRKFCTIQEAAERLGATQEKIEMLLRKNVLHEFRDGPHRLLRTAEVGALVAARIRRLERQGQSPTQEAADPAGPSQNQRPAAGRSQGVRVPRSPTPSSRGDLRPKTVRDARTRQTPRSRTPVRESSPGSPAGRSRASRSRGKPRAAAPRPSLSVREWFWSGLIQDRPVTIALLSGIVLLGLAALVAGICTLADTLR
jgi:excisionase family DNA binding protein